LEYAGTVPEIPVHVGVEVDLPLLDQLHHGGRDEHLRDRPDPEERLVRIDRTRRGALGAGIGVAVPAGGEPVSDVDGGDRGTRDTGPFERGRQQPVQPRVDVRCGQGHGAGGRDRRSGDRTGRRGAAAAHQRGDGTGGCERREPSQDAAGGARPQRAS
jgi:hypothetical protein